MKVLVFSDSHGRTLEMYDAIERECPDAVIHLGDCYDDACDLRRSYPDLPVYAVRGNNDWGQDAAQHAAVCLAGVGIYFTHGHREGCSFASPGLLPAHAVQAGCALALFGHTHVVYEGTHAGVTVLNPGSISLPRQGTASYARLTLDAGTIVCIEVLDTTGCPWHRDKRSSKRWGWI